MWRSAVQVCLGLPQTIIVNYQFSIINSPTGGLAQLARAPALQAGGQRFESVILHNPLIEEEIFDILTHKTVSKDFKSELSRFLNLNTAKSMSYRELKSLRFEEFNFSIFQFFNLYNRRK